MMGGLNAEEIRSIYERYGHLLLRRCKTILREEAGAEDALQEVFINLLRYGAAFREAESKLSWLYRVTDRCCFAQLDKRKKTPVVDEPPKSEVEDSEDPFERHAVLSALSSLEAEDRKLAVLAFVEERGQGEIGKILGFSRQTVNKRLKSLRQRAVELLGDSA